MPALHRVGVLIKRGAVELAEPMRIVGKMARHPVDDDAEAGAMAGIDQRDEVLRRAEAAGRREQAGRLIAPRAVERMLGDREELDMGEAEIAHIGRQLLGQFAIGEPAVALAAAPGAEMHLVDRHRRRERIAVGRRPLRGRQLRQIEHDRGGRRPHLAGRTRRGRISAAAARRARREFRTCICRRRAAPGTKISQNPLPRTRMAWRRPSQPLKSPTTLTRLAFGANTANSTPATS